MTIGCRWWAQFCADGGISSLLEAVVARLESLDLHKTGDETARPMRIVDGRGKGGRDYGEYVSDNIFANLNF